MTADRIEFTVKKRDLLGKKVKQLRAQGLAVGNLVVPGEESIAIVADNLAFHRLYDQAGESILVYLTIEGEKKARPVLVDDVVPHPTQAGSVHFVFREVNLKEKIEAEVPIEVVGEFKLAGATLLTVRDSVEVSALPTDLPENFVVSVDSLTEVGQTISLADLEYDKSKVELVIPEDADPADMPVVLVQEERQEEPEEDETAEAEEGAEGEATQEGEGSGESGEDKNGSDNSQE